MGKLIKADHLSKGEKILAIIWFIVVSAMVITAGVFFHDCLLYGS